MTILIVLWMRIYAWLACKRIDFYWWLASKRLLNIQIVECKIAWIARNSNKRIIELSEKVEAIVQKRLSQQ